MVFSDLYKIMVSNDNFVDFRGEISPSGSTPDGSYSQKVTDEIATLAKRPAGDTFPHPSIYTPLACSQWRNKVDGARGKKQVWRPHVRT